MSSSTFLPFCGGFCARTPFFGERALLWRNLLYNNFDVWLASMILTVIAVSKWHDVKVPGVEPGHVHCHVVGLRPAVDKVDATQRLRQQLSQAFRVLVNLGLKEQDWLWPVLGTGHGAVTGNIHKLRHKTKGREGFSLWWTHEFFGDGCQKIFKVKWRHLKQPLT